MHIVDVLFRDYGTAQEAREALLASELGHDARKIAIVQDAEAFDDSLPAGQTNVGVGAFVGVLLGLVWAMIGLLVASTFVQIPLGVSVPVLFGLAAYGALVGAVAGLSSRAPAAQAMHDALARGRTVLHAKYDDRGKTDEAKRLLASRPGALLAAS